MEPAKTRSLSLADFKVDHELDLTMRQCPMTFVYTRLLIERMAPLESARLLLADGEALENLPANLKHEGHEVISLEQQESGIWHLVFVRCEARSATIP